MRAWMAFLAMVPGCGFHSPSNSNNDANTGRDATIDASTDALGPQFGTFIKITFPSNSDVPTMPLALTGDIDTNDGSAMCDTHNNQATRYCVVAGSSLSLASGVTFRAHGKRPLVLLATATFDLQGTIDVSSKHDGSPPGAGAALAASCPNTIASTGNSGGFGGSFGGKGGNGGPVDGAMGTAAAVLPAFPTDLRGGCPGGDGSSTTGGTIPGAGGSGGGAVLIIAVGSIQMNGKINASGAGGLGGPATKSGGGGGGSGGMIVLDAPSLIAGVGPIWLFANGGGGGQGGTGTGANLGAGDPGSESPDPITAAAGGNDTTRDGGNGGIGSFGMAKTDGTKAGNAGANGGGGAGGGGAGFIRTSAIVGAVIAPLASSP